MAQKEREYDIFISYRRAGGSIPAKWIADSLKDRGYSLFLDVESLRSGPFNEKLYNFIETTNDFILIVPPNGLDRCKKEEDWVRKEIEHAKKHNKNIIPIMLNDFQLPARKDLPESLQFLLDLNWLAPSADYYDAFIDKLETFLISKPNSKKKSLFRKIAAVVGIIAVLLVGLKIWDMGKNKPVVPAISATTQGESNNVEGNKDNKGDKDLTADSSEAAEDDTHEQESVEDHSIEVVAEISEWVPTSDDEANLPDNTLMSDKYAQTDSDGKIDFEKATDYGVFGSNIKRRDIDTITFLSSTENKPGNCWDVSLKRNGKVVAWVITENNDNNLYIAAEGAVFAPISCERMFTGYTNLKSIAWNNAFDTRHTVRMDNLFRGCSSLEKIDISSFDTSSVSSFYRMFYDCKSLAEINFGRINTKAVEYMSYMFCGCSNLSSVDLSCFDTKNVSTMKFMFFDCSSLESIDLSKFITSKVTDMECMFCQCLKLEELDLNNFDTTQVTDMSNMFRDCKGLRKLSIRNFNTRSVTTMKCMFLNCSMLEELDLRSFKTPSLTEMGFMFSGCRNLKALDLSGFDTKNVTDFTRLFYDCESLESLDLNVFNTSKVTEMDCMFEGCTNLKAVNVSSFDTKNVTDMKHMFRYCGSLETLDLTGFDRSSLEKDSAMFEGCSAVVTGWDS